MYFEDMRAEHEDGKPRKRDSPRTRFASSSRSTHNKQALAIVSENGKPSTKQINEALKEHIREGSTIVHDCEKAHSALVRDLRLVDECYKAVTTDPIYLRADGPRKPPVLIDPPDMSSTSPA